MTARLVLWRHGQTDWNLARRFQGRADIALNADGLAQAAEAAPVVAQVKPTAIVASPLARAYATAEALSAVTGLAIETDARLVEVDVGSWQGMGIDEIHSRFPEVAEATKQGIDVRRGETGETDMDVAARVGEALREIAATHEGTVVIVSHGLAVKMGAAALLGWDFAASSQLVIPGNCAWGILDPLADGRWRLHTWNQRATGTRDPILHPSI